MSQLVVDPVDDAAPWEALAPDGGSSGEVGIAVVPEPARFPEDGGSLALGFSEAALEHRVERSLPALDLASLDELRFGIRSDRVADGDRAPFYLELRLGSAGLGLDAPGNTWRRFLPVGRSDAWELVRLDLGDLPGEIRSAVGALRLTCIDASAAFTAHLSPWLAVRDEMVADVEAALLVRLDRAFEVDGAPVDAVFHHSQTNAEPQAPPRPALRLRLAEIVPGAGRTYPPARRDFDSGGFARSSRAIPYDLLYEVEIFTSERSEKATLLGLLLADLAPRTTLAVAGRALPLEWIARPTLGEGGDLDLEPGKLRFIVGTQQELGPPVPAARVPEEVLVEVDQPEDAST